MAPQTRRLAFPQVVIERDTDSESSEDEDENENDIEVNESESEVEETTQIEEDLNSKKKLKAPITISLKKVCKVCKKPGHEAGFKGATYIDCPMKPCFLCKMPGHTTMSCPHRVAIDYGIISAPQRNSHNTLQYVFQRQLTPSIPQVNFSTSPTLDETSHSFSLQI